MLSAYVIDMALCQPKPVGSLTAFFFCDPDTPTSLTAGTIFGSLIKQFQKCETMSDSFTTKLSQILKDGDPDSFEIGTLLIDAISSQSATIVIDGIDECTQNEREIVFKVLREVLTNRVTDMKIFVTSRPDIAGDVKRNFKCYYEAPALTAKTMDAIGSYIDGALQERLDSGKLKVGEPATLSDIRESLVKGAEGM